ncbi:MAG: hypothetical protein KAS32_29515 [Candidatus Peribacteraceae bacterium]|nr:hypothetical protein [Candidatus Peribacteraceae bacterium]
MYKIMGYSNGVDVEFDETSDDSKADILVDKYQSQLGSKWTIWKERV